MIRLLACLALAACAAACSAAQTYEGPERDDSQVAFVVPENQRNRQREGGVFGTPKDGGRVYIRINGQGLSKLKDRLAVLPGRVVVAAVFQDKRTPYPDKQLVTESVNLTFTAVAGRTYAVRGKATWPRAKPSVTLWVVDGTTGRSVASAAVPEAKTRITFHSLP